MTTTKLDNVIARNRRQLFRDAAFIVAVALGIGSTAAVVTSAATKAISAPTHEASHPLADATDCQPGEAPVAFFC